MCEPFSRERGVGQGCPLAPLLFALAIEPLSRMLKQTMSGMHIDRIHVQQDTTHTVVAMCADDTTIFADGLDDIAHRTRTSTSFEVVLFMENSQKEKRKKNGFTETRTQDPVCVRHM